MSSSGCFTTDMMMIIRAGKNHHPVLVGKHHSLAWINFPLFGKVLWGLKNHE